MKNETKLTPRRGIKDDAFGLSELTADESIEMLKKAEISDEMREHIEKYHPVVKCVICGQKPATICIGCSQK